MRNSLIVNSPLSISLQFFFHQHIFKLPAKNISSLFPTFYTTCTLIYSNNLLETATNIPTALVSKARNGNEAAQCGLYEQFSKAMFNICIRMTGNRTDAEDVLQEAFVIAFKNLHQLKEESQFGGWLRRIVVNECIRYSKRSFYWNEWEDTHHENLTEDATVWWKEIDITMVHQQIKGLPDGCRQVFNLFVLEDYSHKDIASDLGISESTSKSQYFRARQLLKERITKHLQTHG